jgi:hypothetical protein
MGPCFRRDDDAELLRRFAPPSLVELRRTSLAMTLMHLRNDADTVSRSRGAISPELVKTSCPQKRGRRECRALDAPAAWRAKKTGHTSVESHHGHIGITRHSPHNGLRLLRALPGDQDFLTPSPVDEISTGLTPTLRRQDHTSWPSASAPFVNSASTSTASRSTYRDDREPPPWKEQDGGTIIRKSEAVKPYSVKEKIL